jgi:hypothetical protein
MAARHKARERKSVFFIDLRFFEPPPTLHRLRSGSEEKLKEELLG